MRRSGVKRGLRVFCTVFALMMAVLPFMAGCGGGGGGGGDSGGSGGSGGGGGGSVAVIANSNIVTDSGMVNGGASKGSTQTMTGSVPNPTGSTTTYGGKAYLILNGSKIPLNVISSTTSTIIPDPAIDPNADLQIRKKSGDSKDNLNYVNKIASVLPALKASATGSVDWVYSVTFSINAGPNTVSIEVYDLNDTLFARTETWNVVGVIEPTSLVVTLWWDTNGTDIDLHMSPDDGVTHCYYGQHSAGQMVLDYDNTHGYGPEHITIDKATGTNTYKIKVYYFADHNTNTPPSTTPTTAYVTAAVNGEVKLNVSHALTAASTDSSWTTGAHVWDAGSVDVVAPNRYTVVMGAPDLSSFPNVKLTVTVTDPSNTTDPKVTGLAASNFYVVNASKVMSPVTVTAAENVYTLSFTDILAGKRDIFVYAIKPAEGTTPMKAGLSNTATYGTNYALFAGLNQYPPSAMNTANFAWHGGASPYVQVGVSSSRIPDGSGDFTLNFTDSHGVQPAKSVAPTAITPAPAAGTLSYKLDFATWATYTNYDRLSVTYKKNSWLTWCVKDTTDLKAALVATGTGMSNSSWDAANFTSLTDAAATKDAILQKIDDIATSMKTYDLFLFHFSGHGSGAPTDGNAAQYLCAYEDGKWISVNDLKAKLDKVPSAGGSITNAIVLMDACHSGNFIGKALSLSETRDENITMKFRPFVPQIDETPGNLKSFSQLRDLTSMSNTFVMAAQDGTSFSWDDGTLKNGVFTYYLLEGINVKPGGTSIAVSAAPANSDHSPVLSGEEAFAYLNPKVQSWVTASHGYPAGNYQHPQNQDNSTSTATFLFYNW